MSIGRNYITDDRVSTRMRISIEDAFKFLNKLFVMEASKRMEVPHSGIVRKVTFVV